MSDSGYSQQDPEDSASDWAARQFQINQILARVRTMVLVKVTAIKGGAGAIASPGTVTVQPLVKLIDGQGNSSSHGPINNIPVFRVGGGTNAVICDPVVGDIGWMAVADRDSSSVKANKAEANPGSRRKFDMADGVYMGSLLSPVPTQYVVFTENGVKIISGTDGINLNGLIINQQGQVAGNLPITGNLELSGAIQALNGSEYGGDISTSGHFFGANFSIGSGGTLISLGGHQHAALNAPPVPGH